MKKVGSKKKIETVILWKWSERGGTEGDFGGFVPIVPIYCKVCFVLGSSLKNLHFCMGF